MAIAGPLGLILGIGAVLGAATSQVIPTRLEQGGDRPWGEVNPERYPEIVAVTYESAPGTYYAPHAYSAVAPVIPLGPWDVLPADDYPTANDPEVHLENAALDTADLPGDHPAQAVPVNGPDSEFDDLDEGYGNQPAAEHEGENEILAEPAPAEA